jgi:ribosomal protein L7/L12
MDKKNKTVLRSHKMRVISNYQSIATIMEKLVPSVDQVDQEELFTVVIEDVGPTKIKVIKEIRTIDSSIGLNEAMYLVGSVPATVLKTVDKTIADKAKAALEAVGAKVRIV